MAGEHGGVMDFASRVLRRDVSDWRDEHSVAATISLHQLHYALNARVFRTLGQGGSFHASKWAAFISERIEPQINEAVRTRVDHLIESARVASPNGLVTLDPPEWSRFKLTMRKTAGAPRELLDGAPTIALRAVMGLRQVRKLPVHGFQKIRAVFVDTEVQAVDSELGLYGDQRADLSEWIEGHQRRWLLGPQPDSILQRMYVAIEMAADSATEGNNG